MKHKSFIAVDQPSIHDDDFTPDDADLLVLECMQHNRSLDLDTFRSIEIFNFPDVYCVSVEAEGETVDLEFYKLTKTVRLWRNERTEITIN